VWSENVVQERYLGLVGGDDAGVARTDAQDLRCANPADSGLISNDALLMLVLHVPREQLSGSRGRARVLRQVDILVKVTRNGSKSKCGVFGAGAIGDFQL
jgi:hypothetical protein